mmetsp:Transcript_15276/g.36270  ORF Transcript_15276/g.36270 Transcript_15276/m.36270 type:complete len:226 (-) Transcript_15276:275-952(-)
MAPDRDTPFCDSDILRRGARGQRDDHRRRGPNGNGGGERDGGRDKGFAPIDLDVKVLEDVLTRVTSELIVADGDFARRLVQTQRRHSRVNLGGIRRTGAFSKGATRAGGGSVGGECDGFDGACVGFADQRSIIILGGGGTKVLRVRPSGILQLRGKPTLGGVDGSSDRGERSVEGRGHDKISPSNAALLAPKPSQMLEVPDAMPSKHNVIAAPPRLVCGGLPVLP